MAAERSRTTPLGPVTDVRPAKKYDDLVTVQLSTVTERQARGRSARQEVPRTSHAVFEAGPNRPDPVALLERQANSRVPELVPIRYGRMLASPFAFFRGAALIMADDLAHTPRSGLTVQACGDAHLSNFGLFASPERNMLFDVNDFDETLPGPWEWDVKRLVASVVVAARDRGFSTKEQRACALATTSGYRTAMRRLAEMNNLEFWYARIDARQILDGLKGTSVPLEQRAKKVINKAYSRDSLQAAAKLTEVVDGHRRFISDPPVMMPVSTLMPEVDASDVMDAMTDLLVSYRTVLQSDRSYLVSQFKVVDLARKIVGVGSVGTRAWVVLLEGRSPDDILLLQAKEAQQSVMEEYLAPSVYPNQGERVVSGQHLMQAQSDIFLGQQRVVGLDGAERDYYVRQLRDWKGSFDPNYMIPRGLSIYGDVCGRTLARAHARSGDRIAIASYLGTGTVFDNAVADFSQTYADQNQRDYDAMRAAVADGRIEAVTGI